MNTLDKHCARPAWEPRDTREPNQKPMWADVNLHLGKKQSPAGTPWEEDVSFLSYDNKDGGGLRLCQACRWGQLRKNGAGREESALPWIPCRVGLWSRINSFFIRLILLRCLTTALGEKLRYPSSQRPVLRPCTSALFLGDVWWLSFDQGCHESWGLCIGRDEEAMW